MRRVTNWINTRGARTLLFRYKDLIRPSGCLLGYLGEEHNIQDTRAHVSRCEVTTYTQAATELLGIQIDAAINPGVRGSACGCMRLCRFQFALRH